jgi:hypothetical protein
MLKMGVGHQTGQVVRVAVDLELVDAARVHCQEHSALAGATEYRAQGAAALVPGVEQQELVFVAVLRLAWRSSQQREEWRLAQ